MDIDDILSDPDYRRDDDEEALELLTDENNRKQKRKSRTMLEDDEQESKRATLSLAKPSYNLGQGSKCFRAWCRPMLRNVVRGLMSEHNWTEASQALSVYLHATREEKSIEDNEFKFTALMDVLAHLGLDSEDRIRSVYDIWIRKNGTMKDQPVEIRFSVHVKFINWCLQKGNLDDAHQTALWIIQENGFGNDQNSNIIVALTFYELWYSTIPKELLRTELNRISTPSRSYDRPIYLEGSDQSNNTVASAGFHPDSSSVQNYKMLAANCDDGTNRDNPIGVDSIQKVENISQNNQIEGFYVNSTDNTGNETSISNRADALPYGSLSVLEGLDPSLFPLWLPESFENDGDLSDLQTILLNDYYKEALKYSRLALFSGAYDKEVLQAYIQLLLVGGQVNEALKELDKFCSDSNATSESMRIRDILLKHFDRHNTARLQTYFEDILKKEPTCCHAMEKLITMHRNGDYSTELLLEMIGLHLDGTRDDHGIQASSATWKEFASCLTKLAESEDDRMSVCLNGNEGGLKQKYSVSFNKIPIQFRKGKSREKWRARWESWMSGHFSCYRLAKDIAGGNLQLLAHKAACASHIYGPETRYVAEVHKSLEKKNETDLFLFLKLNIGISLQLYSRLFLDNL